MTLHYILYACAFRAYCTNLIPVLLALFCSTAHVSVADIYRGSIVTMSMYT
jgi:hypothetical protein